MQTVNSKLKTPKFLKASSLIGLENRMKELILRSGKQYDFYSFFKDGNDYIAIYREELEIQTEILKEVKK